jgi:hypothetical protein
MRSSKRNKGLILWAISVSSADRIGEALSEHFGSEILTRNTEMTALPIIQALLLVYTKNILG